MRTVSVIIPYFQREAGLLRRAVQSIAAQNLSPDITVETIIVDDGSPVPSVAETDSLIVPDWLKIIIIEQDNQGVARARNAALDRVDRNATYIALLDSDDVWHSHHLRQAIKALDGGRDFFFCATERPGNYRSSLLDTSPLMKNFLAKLPGMNSEIIDIEKNEIMSINLRDFVTHPQGTVFRKHLVDDLRFETSVRNAGEDYIFFTKIIDRAARVCFSPLVSVTCGKGVNIYYSSFGWDETGFLRRLLDELKSRMIVKAEVPLSRADRSWIDSSIKKMRTDISFHLARRLLKKAHIPAEFYELLGTDTFFPLWFPLFFLRSLAGLAIGTYNPR